MIIGTAGHIDHGKSSLMRALTGIDTDRLPEEKRRGISIELGYAFLDRTDGERIAFVDVPGHEKLIHAMVSGATGFDHALLIVAADDGVMPQTREHFAILQLLGVAAITVVITKTDRVEASQCEAVRAQVHALWGTSEAPCMFGVSSVSGEGIDALRTHLLALRPAADSQDVRWGFRLPVDRSFSLTGIGTVVTGSAHRGEVRLDDELTVCSTAARRARVRGIHAQNRAVQTSGRGERCALNLAAIEREACPRGAWVVASHLAGDSARMDVQLTLWRDEEKSLRSGTPIHLHMGTQDVMATVAVLFSDQPDVLRPGETGLVQLVFRQALPAWWGDRFLVRDASASRTVGGGRVLDVNAPVRYRRTPQRKAMLEALLQADTGVRVRDVVRLCEGGVSASALERAQGLASGEVQRLLQPLVAAGDVLSLQGSAVAAAAGSARADRGVWMLSRQQAEALQQACVEVLLAYHTRSPDELGPDLARLRRMVAPRLREGVWTALVQDWVARGILARQGAHLLLPSHAVRLSDQDRVIAEKAHPMLLDGHFDPPWVRDIANDLNEPENIVRMVFARQAAAGQLYQVVKDLYYPVRTVQMLAETVRRIADSEGEVLAAGFRDATGLGRKRAIQILEFFDRIGVLRRVGDRHLLRGDCQLFRQADVTSVA